MKCKCDICGIEGEIEETTDLTCLGCYDKVIRLLKWIDDNMGGDGWCAVRDKEGADEWARKTKEILKDVI